MTARITVTGNAATAPEARVTGTGRKVTNFRIGSTERRQDRETGEWVDGNSFFVGVACWNALAENVERSVRIGTPLVVTGRISQRTYTDADDKVQFAYEIQADTVAPDLNRGTADFTRVSRSAGPSVGLDADGNPPVGLADDPWQQPGRPARAGDVLIHGDGSFSLPGGDTAPPEAADDGDREPAELVGAAG